MSSTTIHIPPSLLAALDAKAKAKGVSRNRLIVQTLASSLEDTATWDPEFLEALRKPVTAAAARDLDQTMERVSRQRTRKPPLAFE